MTSDIIADAIMGNLDHEIALCRITCNAVASQAMFCKCGNVLDQKTMTVVTVKTPVRRVIQGFCASCWNVNEKAIREVAEQTQTPILVENWDGVVFKQGEVD